MELLNLTPHDQNQKQEREKMKTKTKEAVATRHHPTLVRFSRATRRDRVATAAELLAAVQYLRRIGLAPEHVWPQCHEGDWRYNANPSPDARYLREAREHRVIGGRWLERRKKTELERGQLRAKNDARFRKHLERVLKPRRVRSLDAVIRYRDPKGSAFAERREAMLMLGRLLGADSWPTNARGLPVDGKTARAHGCTVVMRGEDWEVAADTREWQYHEDGSTKWKGGRPTKYTRATNVSHVRAFGLVVAPSILLVDFHGQRRECHLIGLDQSYHWDVDALGIRLVGPEGDFHPGMMDVWRDDAGAHCLAQLRANARIRAEEESAKRAELATYREVWVSRQDSLRAGNCQTGTDTFARQHKLTVRRYHRATGLLLIAPEDPRVRRAIDQAVKRQAEAMERGYSELVY